MDKLPGIYIDTDHPYLSTIFDMIDNGVLLYDDGTFNIPSQLHGLSNENIGILLDLLQSFSEQYGEVIDYEAAKEEFHKNITMERLKFLYNNDIIYIKEIDREDWKTILSRVLLIKRDRAAFVCL